MRDGLRWPVLLTAICALCAGCGKPHKAEQTFTRELSPGALPSVTDLLAQAEAARSPEDKLALFQQIASAYPDSPRADFAQFMVGFLLAEELKRPADAVPAFQQLKERYPSSEWIAPAETLMAESARASSSPSQ